MRVLDPVSLILRKKGCDIWSIRSDATVYSAMQMMADKDVGALLVIDDGQLVGLISERDYARKVILLGRGSKETPVNEIMVASPITIRPECSVEEAMRLITKNRIRHLPVVCDGKILGMISIGDLVNWMAFAQDHDNRTARALYRGQIPLLARLSRRSSEVASDSHDGFPKWCGVDAQQKDETGESRERQGSRERQRSCG